MRILFVSYAEKTHFLGMVPLAWAARAAGHEVRVASQPELTSTITDTGLTAVPVGRDHKLWTVANRFLTERFRQFDPEFYAAMRGGTLPPFEMAELPPEKLTRESLLAGYDDVMMAYRMANDPMVAELAEFARHWRPDLVAWEPMSYAGAIAARACGAAHGRVLWGLDAFGRMRREFLAHPPETPADDRDPLADWLSAWADRLGTTFDEDMTTGQFTVDQLPEWMRLDTGLHTLPVRWVPYPGRAVVPAWLRERPRRPRVAVTLGLSAVERWDGYALGMGEVLDALAGEDVEVVATVPPAEQDKLGAVPDNVRLTPFVPLADLAPTCAAVVHHAGFGTLLTVGLHGVPQASLPEEDDAPMLARRLADAGVGPALPMAEASGDAVRDMVRRMLDEAGFTAGAARLRDDLLAMPTPAQQVPELATLADPTGGHA